ncbi:hypothetical protein C481_12329 [Natrialba asiatica DSM 12278]|uniref:Uncharacterized protein n=1 Tax=Natrialba asiatica (strain ATCC 700177 / DSM 12278 / JCM 9576 / FERM P-10747 / NBRC 102637 / 172P1) TaxID=29540 RepID=M0ASS8_NATA1|nr:hypothetical protein C481_12329 [Natrialba asiatica DSM 12278]
MTVSIRGTTLRASDIAGNTVSFGLVGWDRLDDPHSFDEPIDATAVGRVSELRYDLLNMVDITRLDEAGDRHGTGGDGNGDTAADRSPDSAFESVTQRDDSSFQNSRLSVEAGDEELTLSDGSYVCRFESNIFVRLRFDGPATLRNRSRGPLTISFPHPTRVTVGFKSPVDYPRDELTVAPTPDGVATALSHLSASIETTTVDRVHRNYRGYPPLLSIDADADETRVPDAVRDATPETDLELVVPNELAALFTVAPLAYYLSARVRTPARTDRLATDAPVLRSLQHGLLHEFSDGPAFPTAVRALLRRTFFLDLLASWVEPTELTVVESEQLRRAGIELTDCSGKPIAERVRTYLSFSDGTIEEVLPRWPYRMTVVPTIEHVSALPHLLYDLAAIDPPSERAREGGRDRGQGRAVETATSADELAVRRRIHGVLGSHSAVKTEAETGPGTETETGNETKTTETDAAKAVTETNVHPNADATQLPQPRSTPVTAAQRTTFTASLTAYENRLSDLEQQSDDRTVVIVFATDRVPESARTAVVDTYTRRSDAVSPRVERVDEPTRAELDAVFETGADFLHYIGNCDETGRGLACTDGTLHPDDLSENEVGLFQLDATNATTVATELVETGSIAGVAGYNTPEAPVEASGDEEVAISTTIGELLLYGQSLATAHTCATVGSGGDGSNGDGDGASGIVVGDGTHRFVAKWRPSEIQTLHTSPDGTIEGVSVPFPVDPVGAHWRGNRPERKRLIPATITHEIEPDGLNEYISNTIRPIYYDGQFYWPEEQKQLLYPIS